MKKYFYIEDNKFLDGPVELPTNWKNISNFNILDDATLKTFGWLPLRIVNENDLEVVVSNNREITENEVIETIITRNKTEEEKENEQQKVVDDKWNEVRDRRNNLLQESDKYVLADRWEVASVEIKTNLTNYRKALRDIPQSNNDPFKINWPTLSL
jgi:hypothetical protein